MHATRLVRIGPYTLRADADADVIAALEASGNKIGLLRACVRLAIALDEGSCTTYTLAALSKDEWALIEKARAALDVNQAPQ
jgi:hypothetical protein